MATSSADDSQAYFAERPDDEIAEAIWDKITRFYDRVPWDGLFLIQQKSWAYHYGRGETGTSTEVLAGGEAGETAQYMVNIIGSATTMVVNMLTAGRLGAEVSTTGDTATALEKAKKLRTVVDYYIGENAEDLNLHSALYDNMHMLKVLGESFGYVEWNPLSGKLLGADDDGNPVYSGDNVFHALSPLDVVRPLSAKDNHYPWVALRFFVNKFDLAARIESETYQAIQLIPEEDRGDVLNQLDETLRYIKEQTLYSNGSVGRTYSNMLSTDIGAAAMDSDTWEDVDTIPMFLFLHRPTAACPKGKRVVLVGPDMVLASGPLGTPDGKFPMFRCAERNIIGRWGGYSSVFDGLALQEMHNTCTNVMGSNFNVTGQVNLVVAKEAALDTKSLGFGLTVLEYSAAVGAQPPGVLQPNALPKEHFQFRDTIKSELLTVIGTNEVSMGNQPHPNMTAEAVSTLDTKTLQFAQRAESALVGLAQFFLRQAVSNLAENYIGDLQLPSHTSAGILEVLEVSREDLKDLEGIFITTSNPLTRGGAGLLTLMNALVQSSQAPQGPEMLATLLRTGTIKPFLEPYVDKRIMLQLEREQLESGVMPKAFPTDDHASHIAMARELMLSPAVRANPQLDELITNYVMVHTQLQAQSQPQQQSQPSQQGNPVPGGGPTQSVVDAAQQTLAPPGGGQGIAM